MHGRDVDVRPEGRAVLAHSPAFVFHMADLPRDGQLARWLARRGLFRQIKLREMPADDFLARVSLDARRARVPADHEALRIEHENRVILDTVDQQPEPLL